MAIEQGLPQYSVTDVLFKCMPQGMGHNACGDKKAKVLGSSK